MPDPHLVVLPNRNEIIPPPDTGVIAGFSGSIAQTRNVTNQPSISPKVTPENRKNDGLEHLDWSPTYVESPSEGNEKQFLYFEGAQYFHESASADSGKANPVTNGQKAKVQIERAHYEPIQLAIWQNLTGPTC